MGLFGASDDKRLQLSWEAWTFLLSISSCQGSCEEGVGKVKARTCCAGINTCLQKPGGSTTICSSWFTLVLWPQFLTAVGASLHSGLTQETVQAALHPPSLAEVGRVEELLEYQTKKLRRNIELTSAYPGLQEHLQLGNPVKWHFQLGSIGPLPLDFRQLLCLGVIKGCRYN